MKTKTKQIVILLSVAAISFWIGYFINEKARYEAEVRADFYYDIARDVAEIYGTSIDSANDDFIIRPKN
jgi:hypothetical protein